MGLWHTLTARANMCSREGSSGTNRVSEISYTPGFGEYAEQKCVLFRQEIRDFLMFMEQ